MQPGSSATESGRKSHGRAPANARDALPLHPGYGQRVRLVRLAASSVPLHPVGAGGLNLREEAMPLFILTLNWTDQGIRNVKDAPKRAKASREMAKKCGVDIKHLYLTSGPSDLLLIISAENGDNVAQFAMALGAQGNVRSRTARAWAEDEFIKLVSALP
jgi:uncharacterized protein with GYD domain